MNGIELMSKAELILLCEKHKVECSGKIADLKRALKRYFEELEEAPLAVKASKPDPASTKSGICGLGDKCPELHSLSHRLALSHPGYRPNPIKCRDGMGCTKIHDKDHLVKYAHEDDLSKVCSDGAECGNLHLMGHRLAFEHPGFRAQPVPCRHGMSCLQLTDRRHLYKYAHEDGATASPCKGTDAPEKDAKAVGQGEKDLPLVPGAPSISCFASASGVAAAALDGKGVDAPAEASAVAAIDVCGKGEVLPAKPSEVLLESASEAVLMDVSKDSEEFWDLEEKFAAHMQGRNEDYVEKRIKAGMKPLRFVLVGAQRVCNSVLEARFEAKKHELGKYRESKELRERVSFHGTHPKNLRSILRYGLLRFRHPLNPCKSQVDTGYFGSNKKGIYVSRYVDYTLKYSNRVCAVSDGDEVKTVMFRTLPGRSKHIEKVCGPIDPTPEYDSHSSPTFLEWYLFDEAQACPQFVLTVRAVEDTRTAADDE